MITTEEFKAFGKILHIGKLYMTITQKIHGSNAQILIKRDDEDQAYHILAGSRSRWLTPDDDNYGFCKWVRENSIELIEKLGEGRHYGEWAGPGINSGEGLTKKHCVYLIGAVGLEKNYLPALQQFLCFTRALSLLML